MYALYVLYTQAGVALSAAVQRGVPAEGDSMGAALQAAGALLTDNTPEARDAARAMLATLQQQQGEGWEELVRAKLSATAAAAVLKATSS